MADGLTGQIQAFALCRVEMGQKNKSGSVQTLHLKEMGQSVAHLHNRHWAAFLEIVHHLVKCKTLNKSFLYNLFT